MIHIWDFGYVGESNILDVLVKNIHQNQVIHRLFKTKRDELYVFQNEEEKDSKSPSIVSKVTLQYTLFVSFSLFLCLCFFYHFRSLVHLVSWGTLEQRPWEVASFVRDLQAL